MSDEGAATGSGIHTLTKTERLALLKESAKEQRARADTTEARVEHLEAGITAAIRKYAFVSPVTFELKKLLYGGQLVGESRGVASASEPPAHRDAPAAPVEAHDLESLAVEWERKANEAEQKLAGLPVGRVRDVQAMYVRTMRKRVGELRARLRRLT